MISIEIQFINGLFKVSATPSLPCSEMEPRIQPEMDPVRNISPSSRVGVVKRSRTWIRSFVYSVLKSSVEGRPLSSYTGIPSISYLSGNLPKAFSFPIPLSFNSLKG